VDENFEGYFLLGRFTMRLVCDLHGTVGFVRVFTNLFSLILPIIRETTLRA
jgi:hypothetical protein